MPFVNLNSKHFTPEEKTAVLNALAAMEAALTPKLSALTPQERMLYGSVNEQNKLVINKVNDFYDTQSSLASPDVDWVEFKKDFDSRSFLQGLLMRLDNLKIGLDSSKILHDWDNYQAALTDYDYTKYKVASGMGGFEAKVSELKQFFKGGGPATSQPDSGPKSE
ncbi:hypothetical protein CLV94_0230 [Flavobacterium endophyticum]|uniref:Uncharacterized protein n=2 Tax=Flavobacterium endophyticum TaxID=1540163 RepID=A0A495MIC4_9FLAO|nr:hypothetical protein CLV94_0230 [Flavobacterium endophyticum]